MKSKLVRQALATAVNKQAIVQLTGGTRFSSVSNQMILPGNVGYVKNFNDARLLSDRPGVVPAG